MSNLPCEAPCVPITVKEYGRKDFVSCVEYTAASGEKEVLRSKATTRAKAFREVKKYLTMGHNAWVEYAQGTRIWPVGSSNTGGK